MYNKQHHIFTNKPFYEEYFVKIGTNVTFNESAMNHAGFCKAKKKI